MTEGDGVARRLTWKNRVMIHREKMRYSMIFMIYCMQKILLKFKEHDFPLHNFMFQHKYVISGAPLEKVLQALLEKR